VLVIFLLSATAALAVESATCPVAAYEGELVKLNPSAFDPDPEIGPAGKLLWDFGPPFNAQGIWQTLKGQRGIYDFWLSVSDGELKDTQTACVELFPNNRNPVLEPVPEVTIIRGQSTKISATCTDPDGDPVEISYRFNGKDVAFILYEPPGTYDLSVTCTDGFGGVDTERSKVHILMPEEPERPKPKPAPIPVITEPKPTEVILDVPEPADPGVVEVVMPIVKHDVVEVRYPAECEPCDPDLVEMRYPAECNPCDQDLVEMRYPAECAPCEHEVEDVGLVIYDTMQDIDTTKDRSNIFTIESEPAPEPVPEPTPEPELVIIDDSKPCDDDLDRQKDISAIMGCCD